MNDASPRVSQLLLDCSPDDCEQSWRRVLQLFRPGVRACIRAICPSCSEHDLDARLNRVFAHLQSDVERCFEETTQEFAARICQTLQQQLDSDGSSKSPTACAESDQEEIKADHPTATGDTQSLFYSDLRTKTFPVDTIGFSTERILALLPRLAESVRNVAAMRLIEGLKYREIAERIGIETTEVVQMDRDAQSQLLNMIGAASRIEGEEPVATLDRRNVEKPPRET